VTPSCPLQALPDRLPFPGMRRPSADPPPPWGPVPPCDWPPQVPFASFVPSERVLPGSIVAQLQTLISVTHGHRHRLVGEVFATESTAGPTSSASATLLSDAACPSYPTSKPLYPSYASSSNFIHRVPSPLETGLSHVSIL
jgi:hypothetical protein